MQAIPKRTFPIGEGKTLEKSFRKKDVRRKEGSRLPPGVVDSGESQRKENLP